MGRLVVECLFVEVGWFWGVQQFFMVTTRTVQSLGAIVVVVGWWWFTTKVGFGATIIGVGATTTLGALPSSKRARIGLAI